MRSFYLLLVGSLLLGASNAEDLGLHNEEYVDETSNAELVEASRAEVACTVDDLHTLFNLGASGTDLLPAVGICSGYRPLPIAVRQQIAQVGRILLFDQMSNTLSAPFCLGLAIAANYKDENPLFYIYDRSSTPVGSLQINSTNIAFTLNGQEALFERNFVANFDRFQLCSNGTFMNLYLNCSLVASTAFSTTGVSKSALISLFTPLLQPTPRFGGDLQQLYISSCSANGIPAQTQVSAQCTSLPAPPTPANACQLPYRRITEVFKQLAPSSSINIDECVSRPKYGGGCTDYRRDCRCDCILGWMRKKCGVNIDDCSSNTCHNGGSCTDGVISSSFTCRCAAGYTGSTCQTNINDCSCNPCQNGGVCIDGINSYRCTCQPGYTGNNCQINIDDCASRPCLKGGRCTDGVNSYTCTF